MLNPKLSGHRLATCLDYPLDIELSRTTSWGIRDYLLVNSTSMSLRECLTQKVDGRKRQYLIFKGKVFRDWSIIYKIKQIIFINRRIIIFCIF